MRKLAMTLAAMLMTMSLMAQGTYDAAPTAHKPVVQKSQKARLMSVKERQKTSMHRTPSLSQFQGLTIYATLKNSDNWNGAGIASVPYGIYTYTIGEDQDFQAVSTDLNFNYMASAMGRKEMIGVRPMELFGTLTGVEYDGLDSLHFKQQWAEVISSEEANFSYIPSVMAYDITSDIIYSAQYNADLTGLNWSKWNPVTRRFDIIHKWNNDFQPLTLACLPNGQFYCVGADGFYYEIDKQTGDASMLGQLGIEPTLYVQSMNYDPQSGYFVWMAVSQSGSGIYALNPADGETTLIRRLSKNEQASTLFFKGNKAPAKAPAAPVNLKMNYSGNGTTTGNLTFAIPTTTYDGSSLSGNVKMSVWLDGQNLANAKEVATGSQQTFAFDLSNDNHYAYVVLQNENGFSPCAYTYEYAGYDVPLAVKNVVLSVNDGISTLSWNAPEGGINGGYINQDAVTYDVVRQPGNVTVAQGISATTFTETLPTKMERYYYEVYPYNGQDKKGAATESNRVLAGSSFEPPYVENFADESTLSLWTIINVNNDSSAWGNAYTWQYQSWGPDMNLSTGPYAIGDGFDSVDDYLVSPGIALKKDITYALTVSMRNTFAGMKERVSLLVGTDPNDPSTFRVIDSNEAYDVMSDGQGNNGRPWEADFQVSETGTYYMAVRGYTTREDNASGLFVYGLRVDELGVSSAPAEVTELTITPEAEGEMQADVSFVVPTKSMGGDDLGEGLIANIYRDQNLSEAVANLNVTAGEKALWTDNTVKGVGVHSYTVSVTNNFGEGKKVSADAFVGVYTAPYANTFDNESDDMFFITVNDSVSSGNTCKWEWSNYNKNLALSYYVQKNFEPIWLFFPAVKMEEEQVYEVNYDWVFSSYNKSSVGYMSIGTAADSTAQTVGEALPFTNDLGYGVACPVTQEVVATKTGKYYPSVYIHGDRGTSGDYIMPTIDNINIKHVASAKAPYNVENLVAQHDMTGALSVAISCQAPAIDFAKRSLSSNMSVSIYRTGQTIPLKTFENVEPGQELQWTDSQPLTGMNSYTVVASNDFGRGKAATTETYAGVDLPEAVGDFAIRGSEDNQQAVLSWTAPSEVGQNGGVVDGSLSYVVCEYFPNETDASKQVVAIATTQNTTYTVAREATDNMEQHIYAVITQTSTGIGKAVLDYTILGKLKTMPFAEPFANGGLNTDGWVSDGDVAQYGATWQLVQDNDEMVSQDGDNGYALCYNGNYYEQYHYGDLVSPKIGIDANKDYKLTFYAYHGVTSAMTIMPTMVVFQSTDDYPYMQVGDTIRVTEGEKGWTRYELTLHKVADAHYLKLCFRGLLSNMNERIWLDNVKIEPVNDTTGITDTQVSNQANSMQLYDLQGRPVNTGKRQAVTIIRQADGRFQKVIKN